jgi:hypothetical protein
MSFLTGAVTDLASSAVSAATGSSTGTTGSAEDQMTAAFNQAIAESAKITALTTEKKVELDAAKQRPQD